MQKSFEQRYNELVAANKRFFDQCPAWAGAINPSMIADLKIIANHVHESEPKPALVKTNDSTNRPAPRQRIARQFDNELLEQSRQHLEDQHDTGVQIQCFTTAKQNVRSSNPSLRDHALNSLWLLSEFAAQPELRLLARTELAIHHNTKRLFNIVRDKNSNLGARLELRTIVDQIGTA